MRETDSWLQKIQPKFRIKNFYMSRIPAWSVRSDYQLKNCGNSWLSGQNQVICQFVCGIYGQREVFTDLSMPLTCTWTDASLYTGLYFLKKVSKPSIPPGSVDLLLVLLYLSGVGIDTSDSLLMFETIEK